MRLKIRWIGGAVFTFLSVLAVLGAGEWPQWRGPNRDGHSADMGLLQEWPSGGPRLLWKTNGIGRGYSSVAVAGGKIFTLGDGPESGFVHALDLTGKGIWTAKLGRIGGGGGYPGPRCTPAVDGGMVYALGQHGDLVCVDANTGKEIWRKNLQKDFAGKVGGWGYSESPLVDGERLLCTPGGTNGAMVALNKKTGETMWRAKEYKDRAEYSSIIVKEIGGARQYIQLTGASVAGIRADDGKLLWRAERKGKTANVPTPIFKDNHVYVSTGYGIGCNLFKVTPGSEFQVEQVYANTVMVNHHGGLILVGEHLYGYSDGKGWVCQDFKTGEMVWSDKRLGKGSVAYADGRLYLRQEGGPGTVVLINASPEGYTERGRFAQPDRSDKNSWPHPVIAGGKLYLRDQDMLLCYDVAKNQ